MKIGIVGAGSMGSLYAGLLARADLDVALVGRSTSHIDAIARHGLRMTNPDTEWIAHPAATTDVASIGAVDLVVILTKMHHAADAVRGALPLFGPETICLTLQNGLGARDAVRSVLPHVSLVEGVSEIGAELIAPGHIAITDNVIARTGATTIGCADGSVSADAVAAIAATFESAGIPVTVLPDIAAFLWMKLALAGTMSSIAGLARLRMGQVTSHAAGWALIEALMGEVVNVAQAKGIALELDTLLARAHRTYESVPNHLPSLAADLRAGRTTEIEALGGALVREAEALDIPVPVTRTVRDLLRLVEANLGQSAW